VSAEPIVIDLGSEEGEAGFLQPLADAELWTSWALGASSRPAPRPELVAVERDTSWTTVYEGPGLDLGALRRVVSRLGASGQRLVEYEDGESFVVARGGRSVVRCAADAGGRAPDSARERALGAPLVLALALRGVHLLHASAIAGPSGVVALSADSGVGKSTLAAGAPTLGGGWERIADDQLPVRMEGGPVALPHFPQLKLAASQGYPTDAPVRRPLRAVVELERVADQGLVEVERYAPAEATLALARATVAARLFDPDLLGKHLDACAAAAREIVVVRLRYPSGLDRAADALATLVEQLDGF